ncbi:MAG: hypothetical protein ACJ8FU_15920 [Xanthobacteraceae bacterium]|jgi:hypothetical protein
MADPEFMREFAKRCDAISRDCFDLGAAERMRLLADELRNKADGQRSTARLPTLKAPALA